MQPLPPCSGKITSEGIKVSDRGVPSNWKHGCIFEIS